MKQAPRLRKDWVVGVGGGGRWGSGEIWGGGAWGVGVGGDGWPGLFTNLTPIYILFTNYLQTYLQTPI